MSNKNNKLVEDLINDVIMEFNLDACKPQGCHWYPPNSYCGWHTNSDSQGWMIYLVWAEENNKSFFRWKDSVTGDIKTKWEKKGWQTNYFKINDNFWHCVGSYTNRISLGFKALLNEQKGIKND